MRASGKVLRYLIAPSAAVHLLFGFLHFRRRLHACGNSAAFAILDQKVIYLVVLFCSFLIAATSVRIIILLYTQHRILYNVYSREREILHNRFRYTNGFATLIVI